MANIPVTFSAMGKVVHDFSKADATAQPAGQASFPRWPLEVIYRPLHASLSLP